MSIAHVVVTVVAAALVGFSAVSVFRHASWVVEPLGEYGVPRSWWPWLASVKTLGAIGLVAGLIVRGFGELAGAGLVLYFIGAEITVLRARAYSHIPYPLIYLLSSGAALGFALAG